ncbi:hypothetical protein HAX54_047383 [Datura stramonium]|uniref:Uncharacterized protein n=1 Tax=Datura stramonium TaxID=4076 RepID=A0ABS8WKZ7_DATST|nr:hypothetical protein [Datura stramonium]
MHGPDFESKFLKLTKRIDPIRPDWRKLYISFLKTSHLSAPMMDDILEDLFHDLYLSWKFTESIRYDLAELKSRDASLNIAFSNRFEWLQVGLLHLSEFHMILARHKDIQHQELSSLLSFVEVLAKEAAIAIYSLCDVDLENTAEVDHMFLPLQVKFSYLKVEISLIQKVRLPESQMDYFQEELTFMKMFLMDSLEQCKEQTQLTDVLTSVLSVTTEADSFINSLSHDSEDGELARKISLLHFQLHLKFKFIKAVIRQICPFISASSTPDHYVIYLLKFLPTYFEAIDSYFTMLKSSKTSPSSGTPTVDEYIECKKQNDLLTKIGTLAIEAEASIGLSYEYALDSSQSRKKATLISTCSYGSFVDGSGTREMSLSLSDFLLENKPFRESCFQFLKNQLATEHNMHEELKDLLGRVQTVAYEEKHFIFFSVIESYDEHDSYGLITSAAEIAHSAKYAH